MSNALLIAWWLTGGFIWTPLGAYVLMVHAANRIGAGPNG